MAYEYPCHPRPKPGPRGAGAASGRQRRMCVGPAPARADASELAAAAETPTAPIFAPAPARAGVRCGSAVTQDALAYSVWARSKPRANSNPRSRKLRGGDAEARREKATRLRKPARSAGNPAPVKNRKDGRRSETKVREVLARVRLGSLFRQAGLRAPRGRAEPGRRDRHRSKRDRHADGRTGRCFRRHAETRFRPARKAAPGAGRDESQRPPEQGATRKPRERPAIPARGRSRIAARAAAPGSRTA